MSSVSSSGEERFFYSSRLLLFFRFVLFVNPLLSRNVYCTSSLGAFSAAVLGLSSHRAALLFLLIIFLPFRPWSRSGGGGCGVDRGGAVCSRTSGNFFLPLALACPTPAAQMRLFSVDRMNASPLLFLGRAAGLVISSCFCNPTSLCIAFILAGTSLYHMMVFTRYNEPPLRVLFARATLHFLMVFVG